TARASWLFAQRRYENYDSFKNMYDIAWPTLGATHAVSAMREFYLNNRDRNKAQVQVDWSPVERLTLSPTAGLLYDDYSLDPVTQLGVNYSHSLRAGLEATYLLDPRTSFLVSYMYERSHQFLTSSTA